jgi:hypothetical protein
MHAYAREDCYDHKSFVMRSDILGIEEDGAGIRKVRNLPFQDELAFES